MEGISLTELVERGLHLVMEQPDGNVAQGHTDFPLISGLPDAEVITDELVAQALEQMDEEEMVYYANFVRHG